MIIIRRVKGRSMQPWLHPGEIVCGLKHWRALAVGDMVIVKHGGLEKIKRITKLDGSKIFISGDNESLSTDSRHFGWLEDSHVVAKVFWPHR